MMNALTPPTLSRRHLRQAAIRKLTIASFLGAGFSFAYGAWIAPWLWDIVLWVVHQIPWWHQAGSFPHLLTFVAAPRMLLGLIWFLYYLLTYGWAKASLSPRQKSQLAAKHYQEQYEQHGEWSFSGYTYTQPARPSKAPISHAWTGELKHQLVEHCYAEYRNALARFDPPPLELKTPPTFAYRKGGKIEWEDTVLVLPEEVLTPDRIHELLPFLAHQLYDYNQEEITQEDTTGFPDYVPLAPLLFFTGNFLWLPVLLKHGTEAQDTAEETAQDRQRVLDRDTFAVLLGQGPALEHQLRRIEEELKRRHEQDTSVPTYIERVGHLSVLNEQERQQMRALGLTPKEPPLAIDSPFRQIGKGAKKKPS